MPTVTPKPALTPLGALLVVAVARYLDRARQQEVRFGISELEIQKLVYFLKVLGGEFPLSFARGRYGPHAEKLTNVLDALEGHYLTGHGDDSARVTELVPITPLDGGLAEAESLLLTRPEDLGRLERLLALVGGFETPYSVALLATVHFAGQRARHTPTSRCLPSGWRRGACAQRDCSLRTMSGSRRSACASKASSTDRVGTRVSCLLALDGDGALAAGAERLGAPHEVCLGGCSRSYTAAAANSRASTTSSAVRSGCS